MERRQPTKTGFESARALVRYVDTERAIIETTFTLKNNNGLGAEPVEIHFRLTGPKGRWYSCQSPVELLNGTGMMRFEIRDPYRWWPAGMGDQDLYDLRVTLLVGDESIDTWNSTIGMTSVRAPEDIADPSLLVNGHSCEIHSIVAIGRNDEQSVLPVAGDTLLLIRDHFGPDVLYNAADRAGILMIQSVPLDRDETPDVRVRREVDRLAMHPSLAGWLVDGVGRVAERIADRVHVLDPTRKIFRELSIAN